MLGGDGEDKMLPWYLNQSQHWIKLHHEEEKTHFVLTNSASFFFPLALSLSGNSSWSLLGPLFPFQTCIRNEKPHFLRAEVDHS